MRAQRLAENKPLAPSTEADARIEQLLAQVSDEIVFEAEHGAGWAWGLHVGLCALVLSCSSSCGQHDAEMLQHARHWLGNQPEELPGALAGMLKGYEGQLFEPPEQAPLSRRQEIVIEFLTQLKEMPCVHSGQAEPLD